MLASLSHCFPMVFFFFLFLNWRSLRVFLSEWVLYCSTLSVLVCWRNSWFPLRFEMIVLLDRVFGGGRLFVLSFSAFNGSRHPLLAWSVSVEKTADNLIGVPSSWMPCFSLAAFGLLPFCLPLAILIRIGLAACLFGFNLFGALCPSRILLSLSCSCCFKTSIAGLPVVVPWKLAMAPAPLPQPQGPDPPFGWWHEEISHQMAQPWAH